MKIRLLSGIAVFLLTSLTFDLSSGRAGEVFLSIARNLQLTQDETLRKVRPPSESQEAELRRMADAIDAAPVDEWTDQRNVRALVIYLVNGGNPQPVRRLIARNVGLGDLENVVLAMLAFAQRKADANALLSRIDAMKVHPSAGAALSLAQGIAFQSKPMVARDYLALAQLLAPGTMIDESASRREIVMLLADKQLIEATRRATRYLWKFGSSLYADDFTSYLKSSVLPELISKFPSNETAQKLLSEIPESNRRGILVDIARAGILSGNLALAGIASGETLRVSVDMPALQNQMRCYELIAKILWQEPHASPDELLSIDRAQLDDADLGILDAAIAVVSEVRAPPIAVLGEVDPIGDTPSIAVTARNALARADKVLSEPVP